MLITVTVRIRDFDPDQSAAPTYARVELARLTPTGDTGTLVSTDPVRVLLTNGAGTVQLRSDTVYRVTLTGIAGFGTFAIRTGSTGTSLAELWSTAQVDPAGFAAVPAPQTVLDVIAATYLPRWQPATHYDAGTLTVNPDGRIARAGAAHTSGTGYDSAGWTVIAGLGGGGGGAVASVAGRTGDVVLTRTDVGLGTVDNTPDAAKPVSTATQAALDGKASTGQLAAKADLVAGVIPTAQIPALALNTVMTVASRAAMLALTAAQVQPGDVAVDTSAPGSGSTRGSYMLLAADPSQFASWTLLNAPTDVVSSVNGQQGTVVLGKSDLGLGLVDNTADIDKPISTPQQNALNLLQPRPSGGTGSSTTWFRGDDTWAALPPGNLTIGPDDTGAGVHLFVKTHANGDLEFFVEDGA